MERKRTLRVVGLFVLSALLCMVVILFLDEQTCMLSDGATLTPEIAVRQYGLKNAQILEGGDGFTFSFQVQEQIPALTLTISDAAPFRLYRNGSLCFQYREEDAYNRNLEIDLGTPLVGETRLTFLIGGADSTGDKLLYGKSSVPKMLIGATELVQRVANQYRHFVTLAIGLYLMMIFSCMVLYLRRKQETYLLTLSLVAFLSMLVLLIDTYAPAFFVSQRAFAAIRSPLFICPVIFTSAIGFYLFQEYIPGKLRPFLTMRRLLCATMAIVIIQYFSQYNLNYMLRILLMLPLMITFCRAAKAGAAGAYLLTVGFGVCEGARWLVYLVNTLSLTTAGELLIYLRVTQLGYLIYLMLCMVLIYSKFAAKFTQAEQLVESLDAKVEKRTRQLQTANRQIQASHQRKHDMMTNIFHDLRTPLFHIQGYLAMLRPEDFKQAETLSLVRERIEYITNLSENLFLAAKLEDHQITFNRHTVQLDVVCKHLIEGMSIAARDKSIAVTMELTPDCSIVSDGFRIRQVLENMLDNAVKYTPVEGRINISLVKELEYAVLAIANTGPGIAQEEISSIFERFHHGADAGSSGLGLYIAHTLMERLGGTLRVTSDSSQTVFYAGFPMSSPNWEEHHSAKQDAQQEGIII